MRCLFMLWALCCLSLLRAEDGSRLWLRMERNAGEADVRLGHGTERTPTLDIAVRELADYWRGDGRVVLQVLPEGPDRDGFALSRRSDGVSVVSASPQGVLYGAYALLRMQQTGTDLHEGQSVTEKPSYDLRMLDHWDNPDGTVERGYAGRSIWRWDELPEQISPRYEAYARANASIGINAVVLNNVNAKPAMLSPDMLRKV